MKDLSSWTDEEIYSGAMNEIKYRVDVIERIKSGEISGLYRVNFAEFIALQFRKILELIAFSSISAHRPHYESWRKNFRRFYKAKDIIDEIEKINPKFYPIPIIQIIHEEINVMEFTNSTEDYLTKEDFKTLYDKCSELLHQYNPYGQIVDIEPFINEVDKWLNKVVKLLQHHRIELLDSGKVLHVYMRDKDTGDVHVYKMSEADPERRKAVMEKLENYKQSK